MLVKLSRQERLRLMKFVCSFAWADLEIHEAERAFVTDLIGRLRLNEDEAMQVHQWLTVPPEPEEIDPLEIPAEHRKIFLDTVLELVAVDGELSAEEAENFNLLSKLLV